MKKNITLAEYIKRRNGVPLGGAGSLSNMFYRSLGAESFPKFWQYWNPIWSYYLGRLFFIPLKKRLPLAIALIVTFAISGALHDLAVMVVKQYYVFFFTPWFTLMGVSVVLSKQFNISFKNLPWLGRAGINSSFVIVNLILVMLLQS